MKCPKCGSEDIDFDQARGEAACTSCGAVLEQNAIVNEDTFQEGANGRSNLVGQRVRADGRPMSKSLASYSREAVERSLANARHCLAQLVSQLCLPNDYVEKSLRLFRLAVENNFHRGRRTINVACACLYAICRIEHKPHMLLDFSDASQTNLYDLGNTYLKFVRQSSLLIPVIDPSIYMHRFAAKLEFEDKTHAVSMTALRVLARMKRDWLTHGRRPAGLCGAALITAAIVHGFYRSNAEVARVVRIGNVSLRKRVRELHRTPTASLTAAQIDAGGGDDGLQESLTADGQQEACDPPAFQRLQEKKKKLAEEAAAKEKAAALEAEAANQASGSDKSKKNLIAGLPAGSNTDEVQLEKLMDTHMSSKEMQDLDQESRVEEVIAAKTAASALANATSGVKGSGDSIEKEKEKATKDSDSNVDDDKSDDGELSDLDDEDTAKYISTEEEYKRKEVLWTETNKDYLEKQARLEKMKRERPEEYKKLRPSRSTKRRRTEKFAETAVESDEPVVAPQPRRTSKKLNYAALKSLDDSDPDDAGSSSAVTSAGAAPSGSTRVSL